MPKVLFNPFCRAITHTAPRIRVVFMKMPVIHINKIWTNDRIELRAERVTMDIRGEFTPDNIGREFIAELLRGELGRHVQASDRANRGGKDVILGLMDDVTYEGRTVSVPFAVAREV